MSSGYSSKNQHYPLVHLTKLLPLNYQREAEKLCQTCGLSVKAGKVQFLKAAFKGDASITPSKIHFIDDKLEEVPLEDIFKISSQLCDKSSDDRDNWRETSGTSTTDSLTSGFERLNITEDGR